MDPKLFKNLTAKPTSSKIVDQQSLSKFNKVVPTVDQQALEHSNSDFVLPFINVEKGLYDVAKRIPSRFYNSSTYEGIINGLTNKQPIVLHTLEDLKNFKNNPKYTEIEKQKILDNRIDTYHNNPEIAGYYDQPSNIIYVRPGLSKNKTDEVLTHEKTHVWQTHRGLPNGTNAPALAETLAYSQKRKGIADLPAENYKDFSERLYVGNLGERGARANAEFPETLAHAQNVADKTGDTSILNFISKDGKPTKAYFDVANAHGGGIGNTIDTIGILNKRGVIQAFPSYPNARRFGNTNAVTNAINPGLAVVLSNNQSQ